MPASQPQVATPLHLTPSMPRKLLDEEIDVFGLTHPGLVRGANQDHFLICSLHRRIEVHHTSLPAASITRDQNDRLAFLAMVADGVGGGAGGEEASRMTLEGITEYVTSGMRCYYSMSHGHEDFEKRLEEAALACHAELNRRADAEPDHRGMATTLTLFFGIWPKVHILQLGDSRYYLFRQGELTQISRDQTMAQALIDSGVLRRTPEALAKWGNVLASAIGGQNAEPVVTTLENSWDCVHMLCSDGLTRHVDDARIADRLRAMTSSQQVCEALLQDALDGGGRDNITIIVGRSVPKRAV